MEFKKFKDAVQRQFNKMKEGHIFRANIDKEVIWGLYLKSFPEGTNPMYRERTEHDCTACKSFIKNAGSMVSVVDGKLVSIWDIKIDSFYQEVANALSNYATGNNIETVFVHDENRIGIDKNFEDKGEGVKTWNHLCVTLPINMIKRKGEIGSYTGIATTSQQVLLRALREISTESIETVLELISQESLYRGNEYKDTLHKFKVLKKKFDSTPFYQHENFCWQQVMINSSTITNIRNSVIGTLLIDLNEGKDLEYAVKAFETKVAPMNYKRPTALITQAMINKAKEKLEGMGLTSSLDRRFAVIEDISVNNVLFVDRTSKKRMDNVFDEIAPSKPSKGKILKVEEIHIESFIKNVLPHITSMEVMFENKHSNNLVSLVAPCDMTAKNMFKWNNPFSWSYTGEVTDSIKERVKSAGGKVDGYLRCSLSWFNGDDLDLSMLEPSSFHIHYGSKVSRHTNGNLDVDMNAGRMETSTPVENICYPNRGKMAEGEYSLLVHQFCKRESVDVGFEVEIEFDGKIHKIEVPTAMKQDQRAEVAKIGFSKENALEIISSIPSVKSVKKVWDINTNTYHKVSVMMLSPNYWDGHGVGNKHYFFMLEGCKNDKARGFFNEFLTEELNEHRKVFEVVGSKMKTDESENQLSGLGFSSTQSNSIFCKVTGSFTRVLKVIF